MQSSKISTAQIPIYRYRGQPIYAVHEVVDESLEIIRQLHSQPNTVTGYPTGLTDLDNMLSGLHREV